VVAQLKQNWIWIAVLCGVGYYIYTQQQAIGGVNAPAGGATTGG